MEPKHNNSDLREYLDDDAGSDSESRRSGRLGEGNIRRQRLGEADLDPERVSDDESDETEVVSDDDNDDANFDIFSRTGQESEHDDCYLCEDDDDGSGSKCRTSEGFGEGNIGMQELEETDLDPERVSGDESDEAEDVPEEDNDDDKFDAFLPIGQKSDHDDSDLREDFDDDGESGSERLGEGNISRQGLGERDQDPRRDFGDETEDVSYDQNDDGSFGTESATETANPNQPVFISPRYHVAEVDNERKDSKK